MPDHELPNLRPIELDDWCLDVGYYLGKEYADIGEASAELPPIIEWVNVQLQQMIERKLIKKQEIKEKEARAYFDLKSHLFAERGYTGNATESALEKALALESTVSEAYEKFAVLEGWSRRLYNLQYALQAKLDLVRSTEATRRQLVAGESKNYEEPNE